MILIKNNNTSLVPLQPTQLSKEPEGNFENERFAYFTQREILDVLNNIKKPQHRMIVLFLWHTGVRVTELVSVKKRDIDFDGNRILIRWLKRRKKEEKHRVIHLHSSLKEALRFYTESMRVDDRVFPVSRVRIYQIISRYYGCGPHKLRHSYAVHILKNSKNPQVLLSLKLLLGHAHVRTTMEYLKISPKDMAVELESISFV